MTLHSLVRRRTLWILLTLSGLLGGLLVAGAGSPATARPQSPGAGLVRPGLGHHVGHDFVGFYVLRDGTKVYCLNPRRANPRRVSLHTVTRYPGSSPATGAALSYALARWGNARSRNAAVVESQVLNTLVGNRRDVARRARALPVALRRATAAHVRQARALRGPYRVVVTLPAALLPGQAAVGSVRVVAAGGRAVPGALVRLRGTANVAVPPSGRTGRGGIARFRYRAVDVGATRVRATVRDVATTAIRVSSPRPGEQRLAAAAPTVAVSASAGFRAVPNGFGNRYSCASNCAGRPRVTLAACAPAGTAASRIVFRAGRTVVMRPVASSPRRRCVTAVLVIADRTRVGASWQYRVGRRWSTPVAAAGTFVVDCPPTPAVTVTVEHDCVRATVVVRSQPSARPARLVIGGPRQAVVPAAPGRAGVWTATVPCGTRLPITVRTGVQRVGGGWNSGPAMSVVTP